MATQPYAATQVELLAKINELLIRLSVEPPKLRLDLDQFQKSVAIVRERAERPG